MQGPRSDPQHQKERERGNKREREMGKRKKYVSLNSVCGTLFLEKQQQLKEDLGMERSFRLTAFTRSKQEAAGINSGSSCKSPLSIRFRPKNIRVTLSRTHLFFKEKVPFQLLRLPHEGHIQYKLLCSQGAHGGLQHPTSGYILLLPMQFRSHR